MKFCKDCKHSRQVDDIGALYECLHPKAGWWEEPHLDLVTGRQTNGRAYYATMMRSQDTNPFALFGIYSRLCGPQARWFEPKED